MNNKIPCIKGKKEFDDKCYDCIYWIKDMPCPPAKNEKKV
jgi:hypothetical protein